MRDSPLRREENVGRSLRLRNGGKVAGMGVMLEREVKLRPGPGFEKVELPGRELEPHVLSSTYFDTDDLRLAAGSITLRRRSRPDGTTAVWQLKLPRSAADRLELEWPAADARVPAEVADIVLAHTRGRDLAAVATLRTLRSGVVVQERGRDIAEVVHDAVEVVGDDGTARRFEELEIELVDGGVRELRRLERRLRKRGASDADGRPKLMQALDIQPRRPRPQPKGSDASRHLVAGLRQQYAEILRHDPGTRLGIDADDLHDHRVAIRRARAFLRVGRPMVDRRWAEGLRDALQPAGRALSSVRDLDVLIAELTARAAALDEIERAGASDVIDVLRHERHEAQTAMRRALSDPAYISLLNRLEIAVAEPILAGTGSLGRIVRKEHRRVRRLVKRLPGDPPPEALHEIRKAVRRARYAAELAEAAGVSGARRYIKRAKVVQDVLGEHQDAVVAAAALTRIDAELRRPAAHMAAGSLIRNQDVRRAAARAELPRTCRRLNTAAKAFE